MYRSRPHPARPRGPPAPGGRPWGRATFPHALLSAYDTHGRRRDAAGAGGRIRPRSLRRAVQQPGLDYRAVPVALHEHGRPYPVRKVVPQRASRGGKQRSTTGPTTQSERSRRRTFPQVRGYAHVQVPSRPPPSTPSPPSPPPPAPCCRQGRRPQRRHALGKTSAACTGEAGSGYTHHGPASAAQGLQEAHALRRCRARAPSVPFRAVNSGHQWRRQPLARGPARGRTCRSGALYAT